MLLCTGWGRTVWDCVPTGNKKGNESRIRKQRFFLNNKFFINYFYNKNTCPTVIKKDKDNINDKQIIIAWVELKFMYNLSLRLRCGIEVRNLQNDK